MGRVVGCHSWWTSLRRLGYRNQLWEIRICSADRDIKAYHLLRFVYASLNVKEVHTYCRKEIKPGTMLHIGHKFIQMASTNCVHGDHYNTNTTTLYLLSGYSCLSHRFKLAPNGVFIGYTRTKTTGGWAQSSTYLKMISVRRLGWRSRQRQLTVEMEMFSRSIKSTRCSSAIHKARKAGGWGKHRKHCNFDFRFFVLLSLCALLQSLDGVARRKS